MPVTSQPTDQPYGQLLKDEKVLEQYFRADYDRWIQDAKKRLGPEAAITAPRVVSKAFHLAWQDRNRFHSKEELDAFLGAQIHHGATRELSRRAGLHRMESHENLGGQSKAKHETHEMTVDEAWERLHHTLQGGAPEAYRARASAARHEAAEHVKELGKDRNWGPMIGIGVAALVGTLAVMWYIDRTGEDRRIMNALNATNVRMHETSYGQQVNITLGDGTIVRLGPESRLVIPAKFDQGVRAVKLEGTAHFNVQTQAEQPFQVRQGQVAVIARGTAFTVRRYKEDPHLVVHVKEGSVDLKLGEEVRSVAKGMSYLVTDAGALRVPTAEELAQATSWADGTLTIVGHTLRFSLPQLRRWYGLDIKVPNSALLDRKVFVSARLDSPREAITAIEKSGGVKFTYIGENMVFEDTTSSRRARR